MKNEFEEKIEFPFFFFGWFTSYQNICSVMWSFSYLFTCLLIALRSGGCVWAGHTSFAQLHSMRARRNGSNETILCVFCSCLVGRWTTISIGLLWLGWMGAVVCVCARTMFTMPDEFRLEKAHKSIRNNHVECRERANTEYSVCARTCSNRLRK